MPNPMNIPDPEGIFVFEPFESETFPFDELADDRGSLIAREVIAAFFDMIEQSNTIANHRLAATAMRKMEMEYEQNYDMHLFEATKALGDYCVEEKIQDIIFLDRSARPAWNTLSEYFNLAHAGKEKPGFHFVDPHVLLDQPSGGIATLAEKIFGNFTNKKHRSAKKELHESGSPLVDSQDSRVLIFDCCVHSGESIDSAKLLLESMGYTDILTGAFTQSTHSSRPSIALDFVYTDYDNALGCKPYGVDYGLENNTGIHVRRLNDTDANAKRYAQRKGERAIIREQFAASQLVGN